MLKIWYYANIEYMKDAPSYFDNVYELVELFGRFTKHFHSS